MIKKNTYLETKNLVHAVTFDTFKDLLQYTLLFGRSEDEFQLVTNYKLNNGREDKLMSKYGEVTEDSVILSNEDNHIEDIISKDELQNNYSNIEVMPEAVLTWYFEALTRGLSLFTALCPNTVTHDEEKFTMEVATWLSDPKNQLIFAQSYISGPIISILN